MKISVIYLTLHITTSTVPDGNKEVLNNKSQISALHKDICNIPYISQSVNKKFAALQVACYNARIMLPFDARGCNITFSDRTTTIRPLKDLSPHGVRATTLGQLHSVLKQSNKSIETPQRETHPIWFRVTPQDLANEEEPGFIYLFQPTDNEELGTMARKPVRRNFLIPTTTKESHRLPIVKIGVEGGNPRIYVNDTDRLPLHLYIENPNLRSKTTIRFGEFITVHSIDAQENRQICLTGTDAKTVIIRVGEIQTAITSLLFDPSLRNNASSQSFDAAVNPFALKQISRL